MPIPDFQNLMLPMLRLAADGAEHRLSDAIEALATQFELTRDERTELLPSGGQPRFENKVGWARTHLGKAHLVGSSRRGWFHITERGRDLLADPPERITVAYLMRYPESFGQLFRTHEPTVICGMIRVLNPIKLQKDGWYAHSTTRAAGRYRRCA